MRKILVTALAILAIASCIIMPVQGSSPELNYKGIRGITQQEIDAIDALKNSGRTLTYGALLSTETFIGEDGQLKGYSVYLCEILSELFGIPVTPVLCDWYDIIGGMADGTIDLSGEFTITPKRAQELIMSDAIAVRAIAFFYKTGNPSVKAISQNRTPVLGFLGDTVHKQQMSDVYGTEFEAVYLERLADVPEALASGVIDAFVGDSVAEPIFAAHDISREICSPLICNSVSLTTQNEDLASIISAFNKYIANGGQAVLSSKYAQGMSEYTRSLLRAKLTAEERDYIDGYISSGKKVPVIFESGNYPISFYNKTSGEYQGIVPDILDQVAELTGLQFESVTAPEEDWATVLAKLQNGDAALISELLFTESRKGQFLWPIDPSCVTNYALLSKRDYPNIEIYQMLGKRVGVEIDTAYQDVASQWFPNVELLTYNSIDDAFKAMDSGEIDLIMASENLLLSQTNYSEKPGYKVNLTIDYTAESKLGFNINQTVLVSIFDKVYPYTDNDSVVRNWKSKVFDYSAQLSQTRVELLLISTILLIAFIGLLVVFLVKNNLHRRNLSSIVEARTAQLAEKSTVLATIYDAIPDLLFSKDTEGRYISCNTSYEEYVGLPESEILGKYAHEIFARIDPIELAEEIAKDNDVMESGLARTVEHTVTYPGGEKRLLETIKTSLKQNNQIVGMMGISRDITAHKAAQDAALTASNAKGSFLARMSHEIRTPLNAIIGMAQIAKSTIGNREKTLASINQIAVSSHHLLSLINDVLDMSKIESGNLEVLSQPFSLLEALEETLTIASPKCREKNIVFKHNVSEISQTTILGDKLRLKQVLINLLSNASKFTDPEGTITFTTSILEETDKKISIQFSVQDSGIGMSKEQVARLFKPFEQADSSIATRFGGTGLGLSISQNLVQRMGGIIEIHSEVDEGSVFKFELTFEKSAFEAAWSNGNEHEPDFTGSRVLLAEDIELNRMIVEELLASTNIELEFAVNGKEAVEMFKRSDAGYYNLIFMDIQMPELNGYQATQEIRALPHPAAKYVPIVAMTANAYKEDVEQAFDAGMDGHIGKPIDMNELMKILSTYLMDISM